MKRIILITLVILLAFGSGFLAGKYMHSKLATKHHKSETENSSTYPYKYTNPLLACLNSSQLVMDELVIFKPKILSYINKITARHPDIHISYYFRDLNNGLWIGINEKEMFSPASLMKVPIMITVLKEAQQNRDLLATKIQYIKDNFKDVDEESGFEKIDKQYYTVEEYIRQMIAYSDNAAALILMQYMGMDKIVKTEKELNLSVNEDAGINTNFVAVNRYAAVFRILYNASYLNKDMSEKALQILSESVYRNGIRSAVPAQYAIAHKYGERDLFDQKGNRNVLQLHHFGIVYFTGKPYLIGVMTRGADRETKQNIIYDLAKITFEEVQKQMQK
ncbi:MAG: serine hydrolase [Bacteroidota bacterium]|jgi:beta-lactamase class A